MKPRTKPRGGDTGHSASDGKGLIGRATRAANLIGTALVLILAILVCADIAGRNLLRQPIAGVPEIVSLSIIVIVFLQAPRALIAGRWTQSDLLTGLLETRAPRAGRAVQDLFDLCGAAVFGVIAYGTWPLLAKAWTRQEFVGAVGDFTAPVWPVRLAVLSGSVLLILNFLRRIRARHQGQPS